MSESNNGEPPSLPVHPKPKRHNAKRCRFAKRQAIIYALANHESVESIRRNYRASRHTVLAIQEQYAQEIKEAQEDIKDRIALAYVQMELDALNKIGQRIAAERSPFKQFKLYDMMTDRIQTLKAPVQKQNPYPLSIKLAALRRAKRNELSAPDRSMWHEEKT